MPRKPGALRTLSVMLALGVSTASAQTLYVDIDATGPHDGASWCNAYTELYEALDAASSGTVIRVANGTYVPDTTGLANPQDATFQLLNGVTIEGGYAGCGADDPNDRNIEAYTTILSGDLAGDDNTGGSCSLGISDCCTAHGTPGCDDSDCPVGVCLSFPACCTDEWVAECADFAIEICSINCNAGTNCENAYHVATGSGTNDTAVLDGLTITGGYAFVPSGFNVRGSGGGMYNVGGGPTVRDCRFVANTARWLGGGIANESGADPTLTNCAFINNSTARGGRNTTLGIESASGGGISNRASEANLESCTFLGNTSVRGGGMANLDGSNITATYCVFQENSSVFAGSSFLYGGGGLYHDGGNLSLDHCTFTDNFVNNLVGDESSSGGGVYLASGTGTVTQCLFSRNSALIGGGMRDSSLTPAALSACSFTANSASFGGGIWTTGSLFSCRFIDNSAISGAGASVRGTSIVANCVFARNTAITGGGLQLWSHGGDIVNCTFTGNDAVTGGAIRNINGSPSLANCVFWDNVADEGRGPQIAMLRQPPSLDLCTITISYTNLEGGLAEIFDDEKGTGCTIDWLAGNLDLDPLLVSTEEPRLGAGSPCIDAGSNLAVPLSVTTDLDGKARFVDDPATQDTGNPGTQGSPIVDMGAYEFQCGSGIVDPGEVCDDGNTSNNDDCLNACTTATCGDGYTWNEGSGTEQCDDGPLNSDTIPDACRTDCTPARCGDGAIDTGEECDNGNLNDGYACSSACLIVPSPLEPCDDPFDPQGSTGPELNRTGCFEMPASAVAAGEQTAIRVRMVHLYISSIEDPVNGCPVRTEGNDLALFDTKVRYLGPPSAFDDNDTVSTPQFVAAELQCTPFYRDWSPAALTVDFGAGVDTSTIYYYGKEVFPCSVYEAQQATQTCVESASENCFSDPLEIRTGLWGDVWAPFGVVSFTDIGKVVDAFKSLPFVPGDPPDGAPRKVRAMLRGNSAPLDSEVSFTDIGRVVDAFKTIAYAEDGPTACP